MVQAEDKSFEWTGTVEGHDNANAAGKPLLKLKVRHRDDGTLRTVRTFETDKNGYPHDWWPLVQAAVFDPKKVLTYKGYRYDGTRPNGEPFFTWNVTKVEEDRGQALEAAGDAWLAANGEPDLLTPPVPDEPPEDPYEPTHDSGQPSRPPYSPPAQEAVERAHTMAPSAPRSNGTGLVAEVLAVRTALKLGGYDLPLSPQEWEQVGRDAQKVMELARRLRG